MKKLLTCFSFLFLSAITALTFASCGSSKFKINANNGYYADGTDLSFLKDGKIYEYDLEDGTYNISDDPIIVPKNITKKNICYTNGYYAYVIEKNKISRYTTEYSNGDDGEEIGRLIPDDEKFWFPFDIPEKKYKSVVVIKADLIMLQTKDKISFYCITNTPEGLKWKELYSISSEKEYDTSLLIDKSGTEGFVGFIKGTEVDVYYFDTVEKVCKLQKSFELKKEYDAYIGFIDDDDRLQLGCLEGKKIMLHDISFGAIVSARTL